MPTGCYSPNDSTPETRCQPGSQELLDYIVARFAGTDKRFGCFNPNSRTDSGRSYSLHAAGRAIDIYVAPDQRGRHGMGQALFLWAVENADGIGVQEVIWDSQIWTHKLRQFGIRYYGANPHRDHVHLGQCWAGANRETAFYKPEEKQEDSWVPKYPKAIKVLFRPKGGTWVIASDGGVFTEQGAPFYGSMGGVKLKHPITDACVSAGGEGYHLLGRDGGVFDFGDAKHYGSYWELPEEVRNRRRQFYGIGLIKDGIQIGSNAGERYRLKGK